MTQNSLRWQGRRSGTVCLRVMLTAARSLRTDTAPIRITIAGTNNEYFVQRTLLAAASSRFLEALNPQDKSLRLRSQDSFRMFAHWLYYRRFPKTNHGDGHTDPEWTYHGVAGAQAVLVNAWNFGDEWAVPAFQNAIMRLLHRELQTQKAELDAIAATYKGGSPDSVLRQLLVADLTSWMHEDGEATSRELFRRHGLQTMPNFMLDVTEALRVRLRRDKDTKPQKLLRDVEQCMLPEPES